jgi:hypothetical protein
MSIPILINGKSGSGKSRSIVGLNPVETFIVASLSKDLPFRGWRNKYTKFGKDGKGNYLVTDDYETIDKTLTYISDKRPEIKTATLDDRQYLMANEFMRRHSKVGGGNAVFSLYNDIGDHFWHLIMNMRLLRQDLVVIMLHHCETTELGETKAKTIGKMLDDKIVIEGMFSIVLNTSVENGEYFFETQTSGFNTTKSPEGMFAEKRIPNDLNLVVQSIHKYNTEE